MHILLVKLKENAVSSRPVEIHVRGHALWIRLNRPAESNAISPALLQGIDEALEVAEADSEVRSVVIAANGEIFCAGADLKFINSLLDSNDDARRTPLSDFLRRAGDTLNRLETFPKPVVGAVQGLAIAGGLEILLCCDVVIAARSARLGDGHANFGLIPGAGGSIRLARRIGQARAKLLMFTGLSYPAADFVGTDLVHELVDDGQLEAAVDRLTDVIAGRSPLGLRRMKELANSGVDLELSDGLELELRHSAEHEHSADFHEGITAFNQRRRPTFIGR